MPTYYAELTGGTIKARETFSGGTIYSGGGVATLQTKSVSYTPSESAISDAVTPDSGYDGLSQVTVNVGAISSTYVGSEIPRNDSTDVYRQSHYVGIPEGYYADDVIYDFPLASTPYGGIDIIDSSGNVDISIEIDNAGYIGNGTYSITDAVPVQAAQTITPGTTDQTITRGKWLGGDQTILGDADLVASNIKKDVTIFGVTGTYEGGGGTTPNDVLNSIFNRTISGDIVISKSPSDGATSDRYNAMFSACNSINSVTLNGWLTTPYNFLQNCTSVKSVSMPDATYVGTNVCDGCSNLETANFPLAETVYWSYLNHGGAFFRNCKKLTSVNMPKTKDVRDYMFQNCYLLPALELDQNDSIQQRAMSDCRVLQTLILRNTTMVTLSNVNAFQNTPFTGYGGTYSGHIYVPQSLISSYQTASNWSTLYGNYNGLFTAIEGSPYENARLDGTPLT